MNGAVCRQDISILKHTLLPQIKSIINCLYVSLSVKMNGKRWIELPFRNEPPLWICLSFTHSLTIWRHNGFFCWLRSFKIKYRTVIIKHAFFTFNAFIITLRLFVDIFCLYNSASVSYGHETFEITFLKQHFWKQNATSIIPYWIASLLWTACTCLCLQFFFKKSNWIVARKSFIFYSLCNLMSKVYKARLRVRFLARNSDPGLCTSNTCRFKKFYFMNILDTL